MVYYRGRGNKFVNIARVALHELAEAAKARSEHRDEFGGYLLQMQGLRPFFWSPVPIYIKQVIGGKDEFIDKLLANIEKELSGKEYEFSMEEIDERLTELQKELMTLVRLNARTGLDASVYSDEYAKVSAEIELFRERRQKLKEESAMDSLRIDRIKGLKAYLMDNDSVLERFDGALFGRLIEKVMVTSLVEVTFVFKTGVEVREVLGE